MFKKGTIGFIILLACTPAFSQTVTIEQLIDVALRHHPHTNKIATEQQLLKVKRADLNAAFLPGITLNAQAGYQSMVPELAFQLPGMSSPNIPKDRYQASIDVNQLIYDGGSIKQREHMMNIESQMTQTRIMAERFPIQKQVVDAWFGLELLSMQRSALILTLEDLEARLRMLQVGLDGGIVMQMDVDRIAVELERVKQKDAQIQADSVHILEVLSEITGISFTSQTVFTASSIESLDTTARTLRPEEVLFNIAAEMADAKLELDRSERRPKVSGYAQGAYGKPGLDIFADSFSPFWQAGVKASWSLWDKGGSKRDLEIHQLTKKQIEDDRALFDRNIHVSIHYQEAEIDKNREMLKNDEVILGLQKQISSASEAKLDEGIINATDYLNDVRAVEQARIQYESRKIAIRYALTQILIIRGGL